ncbi:MAG: SDR family oxidoreductase [Chloroflexota bacterium]
MATIFLTGFPGFLGSALVANLLKRYPADVSITCLIQAKFRQMATARADELTQHQGRERIRLVEGDITLPDLGLGDTAESIQQECLEVYHLAAVYDLGVDRLLALRVNLQGTQHMLDFAQQCPQLNRFQYVSTCYVSGRYDGVFGENDLVKGQPFNNYYEETKYLAEVEVQRQIKRGLPATIYRPAIVLGDSETGETQKYDGPYYVFQWILRQPKSLAVVPVVGRPSLYEVNVVPRNFVIDAITYLSAQTESLGQVYQLCDPHPLTVADMLTITEKTTGRRLLRLPLPKSVAKGSLKYLPGIKSLMRIEPEAVEYFVQPTRYTSDNTQRDLAGSGISCPPFASYAQRLIDFMKANPVPSSGIMV